MENTENQNLVDMIRSEVNNMASGPETLGLLKYQSANKWIADAKAQPDPDYFYHGMFVEGDITIIFSAPNTGKSLFMMQVAAEVARTKKVLVIDCEQSSKQFQLRYTNETDGSSHHFPENLLRAELDAKLLGKVGQDQAILDSVREAAHKGIRVIVIDNITFVCVDTEKSQASVEFMHKLIQLKMDFGLTLFVVAHTPKRNQYKPLDMNDLSGSSKLMGLCDASYAIGKSTRDASLRYVKTIKFRSGIFPCPEDHVALYRLEKVDDFTQLVFQGYGNERDHLRERNEVTEQEDLQEILKMKELGKSYSAIALEMGISKSAVHRRLKKAENLGVVAANAAEEESEPSRSGEEAEREERPEQKDEEEEMWDELPI